MRLADLHGKSVRCADGRRLGVVHEVRVRDAQVEALDYGPGGLIERFTARRAGQTIRWTQVKSVDVKAIVVDL
jgi:hypothetical protein